MKKILLLFPIVIFVFSANASAQPRQIERSESAAAKPAPASFPAKYEGGMFGFNDREEGTLKFDDPNERLVFYGKDQKEKFSLPYNAMLVVSPQSQTLRSTTGTVVGAIPVPGAGLLGGFIREKRRYLLINFEDPDADVKGLINFKLEDKDLLDSVIETLGQKAALKKRGDAYYRPKDRTT